MACPALPTCGLALADAERILPSIIDTLEVEFRRLGIDRTPLTIRMTGCPNGCARPYNADIGFVGRKPDVYHIFVGGGLAGDRMADLFAADVPVEGIVEALSPLLEGYRDRAHEGESLGDYYQRAMGNGSRPARTIVTGEEDAMRDRFVQLSVGANGKAGA
jgi:sulfite reductase beta subunit-like hemoprotein